MEANESLAYVAGFLDGEGCISIASQRRKYFSVRVTLTNTCLEVLQRINVYLPGNIQRCSRKGKCKDVYLLVWHGQTAIDVLELLLPYLIVKRKVAEVAMEFYWACIADRPKSGHGVISEAEKVIRNLYKADVGNLNRRGVDSMDTLRI